MAANPRSIQSWFSPVTSDLRRGVDLLLSRPDVAKDRLGYAGGSYGGAQGGLLSGVETRIKAYVLVVGDGRAVRHNL